MSIKNFKSLAVAAALVVGGMSAAHATTIIDGITIPNGATFSTITLFEGERLGAGGNNNGVVDVAGEELVGVGIVNQILDINNNVVWSNGDNGKRLTIVLQNYLAAAFNTGSFGTTNFADIGFTGGNVKIYSGAAGVLNASGTQASVLAAAAVGNLWLDLTGSPNGGFAGGLPITLKSTALNTTGGDPLLSSTNLTGQGFLDVAGGLAGGYFDTNKFGCIATDGLPCPDTADLKFTSSGQLNPISGGQQFGFRGTGEIALSSIPVPGTLALTGLALLGLGLTGRRNKA